MLKRGFSFVMSFAMASSAFAGATVDFVVTDFGNTPCMAYEGCAFEPASGPFLGGETILAHVMVTSSESFLIRGAQIDTRASSPELGLGQDIDAVNQPLDGIPNFWFDYSPIIIAGVLPQGSYPASGMGPVGSSTGNYIDFSNLLRGDAPEPFTPATVWPLTSAFPGMLQVEAGVPFRLGGMPVTLPSEPGTYTLDVLNLNNTDTTNLGMVLDFGFGTGEGDKVTKWASAAEHEDVDDVITYANGPLTLTVIPEPVTEIPEPVTLILLSLGGLAAVRRRW